MVGAFVQKEIEKLRREAGRPKHRFLISISRVETWDPQAARMSVGHVAQVIDVETRLAVHETPPQPDEQDARVAAGLWIVRQEASE